MRLPASIIALICSIEDTLSGISVYTPSNTGPQTPLAASSPPENLNYYFETSPRQGSSHFHPTSNIISPPTLLNTVLAKAPPGLRLAILQARQIKILG